MPRTVAAFALIVLCGCIELFASVYYYHKYLQTRKLCTGSVTATCIRMSYVTHHNFSGRDHSPAEHPYLKYCVQGIEYDTVLSVTSGATKIKVGDSVTLHYNPSNPTEYYLEEDKVTKEIYIVFIVSGVLTTLLGVCLLVFVR